MKKILISLLLAITLNATADTPQPGIIMLNETNHTALVGPVTSDSIAKVILSLAANKSPTVYLYIDSPGGDVLAGNNLIEYFITSKQNIVCVAKVAISMAHQILQACPKRVGTPDNILMQHRMTAGTQGNVDQMQGLLNVLKALEVKLNTMSAKRIGIPLKIFFEKVNNEWWTFGTESRELNIIDEISHVGCEASLYSKDSSSTVRTFFGEVDVLINACPLIPMREAESKKR